jgi:hypothetical protein
MTDKVSERVRRLTHVPASREVIRGLADAVAQLENRAAAPQPQPPADDRSAARQILDQHLDHEIEEPRRWAQALVSEPLVYDRHSPNSYFADLIRDATGRAKDLAAVRQRLSAHEAQLRVILPPRRQALRRAAGIAYENAFGTGRDATRALERMDRLGIARITETRAITRGDGQGGYVGVPPMWLIDDYVNAPRAGRPLADLFQSHPLPSGTDSLNIPRLSVGTATGQQNSDIAPAPGRDPADQFTNCRVMTIAGQLDASMQWCEQSAAPGADESVFRDMMQDYAGSLDAQLILGNSFPQLNGLLPGGAVSQASSLVLASSNNSSTSPQTWSNGGTAATFNVAGATYAVVAQAIAQLHDQRGLPPTHVVLAPWLWWSLIAGYDNAGRPLVTAQAPLEDGSLPGAWLPAVLDANIPVTFGGTIAPYLGAVSNGVAAPQAGTGGTPNYTPVLIIRAPDL